MDSLANRIRTFRERRRAVILAGTYTPPEVLDLADFVGDSPELAFRAAEIRAYVIVFCGVHFMAETAKLLNTRVSVLMPDLRVGLTEEWLTDLARRIKCEFPLAVTLSLGERRLEDLAAWRATIADRYLLRFETSNAELFAQIHPPRRGAIPVDRIGLLGEFRRLGYEVGSGVMVGIPDQTYKDLARDLGLFGELDLDMIGVGPFIAHPATPLATGAPVDSADPREQVPATERMTYKTVALARLCCPRANIPSTTALATLNLAEGRELDLQRGPISSCPISRLRATASITRSTQPRRASVRQRTSATAACDVASSPSGEESGRDRVPRWRGLSPLRAPSPHPSIGSKDEHHEPRFGY